MVNQAIQVKGFENLSEKNKKRANEILEKYYFKIQRQIKNSTALKVYIKEYKKEGKKQKFSINVELVAPTRIFEANSADWDFIRTLNEVLNKIINQVEHDLHSSNQHDKL